MFKTFEQTSRTGFGRRLLMMMVSIVAHAVAIFVLVVLPLLFFNVLPERDLLTWLTAAPAPPAPTPLPVPPTPVQTVAAQEVAIRPTRFVAPEKIPDQIPLPAEASLVVGIAEIGIRDGIPVGPYVEGVGVLGGVVGIPAAPPAPLPLPPRPVKHPPVRVSEGVQESRLIKKVEPVYPDLAKRARVSGIVILEVTIDEEGNVADVKVLRGHPLLDDEVVRAVRQWKYSPTLLNGEPVPVTATVTVIFSLR